MILLMLESSRKKSKKIKYLKTISKTDSNKYTLYGNSQYNNFECMDNMSCIMNGDNGGDYFRTDVYSQDYIIKDFKHNKNADQIIIKGNESNVALRSVEYEDLGGGNIKLTATCGDCIITEEQKRIIDRNTTRSQKSQ